MSFSLPGYVSSWIIFIHGQLHALVLKPRKLQGYWDQHAFLCSCELLGQLRRLEAMGSLEVERVQDTNFSAWEELHTWSFCQRDLRPFDILVELLTGSRF